MTPEKLKEVLAQVRSTISMLSSLQTEELNHSIKDQASSANAELRWLAININQYLSSLDRS